VSRHVQARQGRARVADKVLDGASHQAR